jgi:hypothetical protein
MALGRGRAGALPGCPRCDLAAVLEAELGEDVLDVVLGGALSDVEEVGDLPVGEAAGDQLGDLAFAPGQAAGLAALGASLQAAGQAVGVRSQDRHAEPGRAAGSIAGEDERFCVILPPAAPGQGLRELIA